MRLSTRGKYGLYAMHYLAQHEDEGPQSLNRIASVGIPKQYLEQLLGGLRRNGLINSVRGANGGYQIAKPSDEITVLDILDAMEGPAGAERLHCRRPMLRKGNQMPRTKHLGAVDQ